MPSQNSDQRITMEKNLRKICKNKKVSIRWVQKYGHTIYMKSSIKISKVSIFVHYNM